MTVAPGAMVTANIRIVRLLGRGGMGSVWVARHLALDTDVAVKFIAAELLQGDTDAVLSRFRLEAQLCAKIDSPHVVRTLDHGVTDEGTPYIVMELLQGESLAQRLSRVRTLEPREVADIVERVAEGLHRAHALGIVHRDVKPHNIFLLDGDQDGDEDEPGAVKILDFGVAKHANTAAEATKTASGVLIGTPQYMSPEQLLRAAAVDAQADLWALSVVTYESLFGVPPFLGETLAGTIVAVTRAGFERPTKLGSTAALDGWFERALAIEPSSRFANARELARSLRAAVVEGVAPTLVEGRAPLHGSELARPNATQAKRAGSRGGNTPPPASDDSSTTREFIAKEALDVPPGSARAPERSPEELAAAFAPTHIDASGLRGVGAASAPSAPSDGDSPAPGSIERAERAVVASKRPLAPATKKGSLRVPIAVTGGLAVLGVIGVVAFTSLGGRPQAPSEVPRAAASGSAAVLASSGTSPAAAASIAASDGAKPVAEPTTLPAGTADLAPTKGGYGVPNDDVGNVPQTTIAEGFAPYAHVFLPVFRVSREDGDEDRNFLEAQEACERRSMSLCSDAQWTRACTEVPKLAKLESWTITALGSAVATRGGDGTCERQSSAEPATRSPSRAGVCCTRVVGVTAQNDDGLDFLRTTATKLREFENAVNVGDTALIKKLVSESIDFYGKELPREDAARIVRWYGDQKQQVLHDTCDVSLVRDGEDTGWTALCRVVTTQPSEIWSGTRRYLRSPADGLLARIEQASKPQPLWMKAPANKESSVSSKPESKAPAKQSKKQSSKELPTEPPPPPPPPAEPIQQQSGSPMKK